MPKPEAKAPVPGAADTSVQSTPGPLKTPRAWAKEKLTDPAFVAGAYWLRKWVRDHDGNDQSLCTESDFDAAIAKVMGVPSPSASAQSPSKP